MRAEQTSDLWWKDAVIYCLDVETFDGDLAGLIDRIGHVAELGASCVWLMPLYPSPNRDDGYDISDYLGVDPRLGDLSDVVAALRQAGERGLRVLADLVVNHTSDEHPWFLAARESRTSPFRDYYVWTDDPAQEAGTARENWSWDERAGQFYMHRFAPFQPDLNITNPAVRERIAKTAGFWLALGVCGFRMDAVPFLVEEAGVGGGDARRWLHSLREYAGRRRGDAALLGEVNVDPDQIESYFEDHGEALHLQLGFLINQRLWLALARGEAAPLEDLMRRLPVPPHDGGWATFLRNHDELTLDKLDPDERDEVFAAFAPDPDMRIYGHGIRRRAASMLGGDGPRLRMAWSLTFALPGTPVILYGDEIGMEEDLAREGRMSVRTPMRWDAVARQRGEPGSLLAFMTQLIRTRREAPELGFGETTVVETEPPALLALRSDWDGTTVVTFHNLSAEPLRTTIDAVAAHDLLERRDVPVEDGRLPLELAPYGFRWLRVTAPSSTA